MDDETFEIIKAGAPDAPPEQALYRIQQTYPDGSGGRLNVDWEGLLRLHELIHDRIALEDSSGRDYRQRSNRADRVSGRGV